MTRTGSAGCDAFGTPGTAPGASPRDVTNHRTGLRKPKTYFERDSFAPTGWQNPLAPSGYFCQRSDQGRSAHEPLPADRLTAGRPGGPRWYPCNCSDVVSRSHSPRPSPQSAFLACTSRSGRFYSLSADLMDFDESASLPRFPQRIDRSERPPVPARRVEMSSAPCHELNRLPKKYVGTYIVRLPSSATSFFTCYMFAWSPNLAVRVILNPWPSPSRWKNSD